MFRKVLLSVLVTAGGCAQAASGSGLPAEEQDAGLCTTDAVEGDAFTLPDGRRVVLAEKRPLESSRGENTWELQLVDANGNPVTGAEVAIRPYMPAHAHATNPAEFRGLEGTAGTYTVGPMNLFMPGEWQFTVRVGADISIVFHICLVG